MSSWRVNFLNFTHFITAAFLVAVVAFANFILIRYWFYGEFSQNMGSIEISYIQMAKFWEDGGMLWRAWWYLGHPGHVFYTPLLPAFLVFLNRMFDISFAHAYRLITGAGYVLVPVSVFFFVWQLAKSKTGAFVSALIYSFVPSIIALLFSEVAADSLSGTLEPRRFAILVRWGEGPHTLALVFIPLFGLFLSRYFAKSKFYDLVFASVFLGLCALTNAIAVWVALLLSWAFLLGSVVEGVNLIIVLKKLGQVFVLSFGLIAFWYNLPFISTFFKEGGGALNNWFAIFPWGLIVLIAVFALIFLVVKKLFGKFTGMSVSVFWFLMLFAIVYVYYASGTEQLEYAPQALRLTTEVDMAMAVLAGVFVSNLFLFFTKRFSKFGVVVPILGLLLVAFIPVLIFFKAFDLVGKLPTHTRDISYAPIKSVENTAEFRVAKKLEETTAGTNQRVLVPGNYGFWLDYFAKVPQIRGALFQSSTNFWPEHIYYQITNGLDAQISLAWLKITNVGVLVYTGPGSSEIYKDYKVPIGKFEGILAKSFEENGDVYFKVPLLNDSLAKVVDGEAILGVKKPKNAIDKEPIFAYVGEIEKYAQNRLGVERISESRMKIRGNLAKGQAILVQETYDPGWKVAGGGWEKEKDHFDFMVLTPSNFGDFEVELVYTKPLSVYFGYLVSVAALGFIIKLVFFQKRPKEPSV